MTRSWLDTLLDRGNEAKAKTAHAPQIQPAIAKPRQPKPEIKNVWVQTVAPRNSEDPGACEAGYYSVVDGAVIMHEENGKPTGQRRPLAPGDDAHKVACRLTLAAWRGKDKTGFDRRINYA